MLIKTSLKFMLEANSIHTPLISILEALRRDNRHRNTHNNLHHNIHNNIRRNPHRNDHGVLQDSPVVNTVHVAPTAPGNLVGHMILTLKLGLKRLHKNLLLSRASVVRSL